MRRFIVKVIFLSAIAVLCGFGSFDAQKKEKIVFLIPINHINKHQFNLVFKCPANFKRVSGNSDLLEFIPIDETIDNRSKIMTLQMLIGKKISAASFLNELQNMFFQTAENVTVIEHAQNQMAAYQVVTLALAYTYSGKNEIVYMRYYSGPYDLAGIQYTKVIASLVEAKNSLKEMKKQIDDISFVNTP